MNSSLTAVGARDGRTLGELEGDFDGYREGFIVGHQVGALGASEGGAVRVGSSVVGSSVGFTVKRGSMSYRIGVRLAYTKACVEGRQPPGSTKTYVPSEFAACLLGTAMSRTTSNPLVKAVGIPARITMLVG